MPNQSLLDNYIAAVDYAVATGCQKRVINALSALKTKLYEDDYIGKDNAFMINGVKYFVEEFNDQILLKILKE
jgi:putative exporter of polyketide antibiotics